MLKQVLYDVAKTVNDYYHGLMGNRFMFGVNAVGIV